MIEVKRISYMDLQGTMFQGYLTADYSDMVAIFGKPEDSVDISRTRAEWFLELDGVKASVYDWKLLDTPVEKVTKWSIGGNNEDSCILVIKHYMEEMHRRISSN